MQTYTTPLHDENSHAADAFGEFAINCGIKPKEPEKKPEPKWPVKAEDGQMAARLPSAKEIIDGFKRKQR